MYASPSKARIDMDTSKVGTQAGGTRGAHGPPSKSFLKLLAYQVLWLIRNHSLLATRMMHARSGMHALDGLQLQLWCF